MQFKQLKNPISIRLEGCFVRRTQEEIEQGLIHGTHTRTFSYTIPYIDSLESLSTQLNILIDRHKAKYINISQRNKHNYTSTKDLKLSTLSLDFTTVFKDSIGWKNVSSK